jgi:hypothetical protein
MNKMALINQYMVLIDPIVLYRGGIAQHIKMLHQALKKLTTNHNISFYRQYPGHFFPVKSDKEPDQKYLKDNDEEYLIDSHNPISWDKAIKRRNISCV